MATLYVENIPQDLYEALRGRARQHRNSIAAEVLALLQENVPTAKELRARQEFFRQVQRLRARRPRITARHISTAELQREDRRR